MLPHILGALIVLPLLGIVYCTIELRRNDQVYRYRKKLLDSIFIAAKEDTRAGRDWHWRVEMFEAVSYDRMVTQFWNPLDSFYDEELMYKSVRINARNVEQVMPK